MSTLAAGTRLGRFEILALLGVGGMGQVYRARDTRLEREVALKFLHVDSSQNRSAVERFQREAKAASALNHPNIVTVYDVGELETGEYIAMELVHGRTLRALALAPPPMLTLLPVVLQTAQALRAAHAAGIVHRDIKPENIMVRDDGYVKILDFGLARLQETREAAVADTMWRTEAGIVAGTVSYMSPEQSRGQLTEHASDVFSLGLVWYEVATGSHPFNAASIFDVVHGILAENPVPPSVLRPDIPTGFEALILQMLQKEPALRPTSEEIVARLETNTAATMAVPADRGRPVEHTHARATVGHVAERRALRDEFQRVLQRRGAMVCIAGEPGAGKTTLVASFLADVADAGVHHRVIRGQCSERLGPTGAYLPIIDSLSGLLREDVGEVARTMRLLAPSWYSQLAVFDHSTPQPGAPTLARTPDKIIHELSLFVEELARHRPLIWFIDDVHWADPSTVELIAYLCHRFESIPLLLIVTYRPAEMHGTRHPFLAVKLESQSRGVCREIPLSFLSEADTRSFLSLMFPEHALPDSLAGVLYERTEGNPLFLSELVRDLAARGVVSEDNGQWRLTRSIEEVESSLPESIRSVIQRKIDYLEEADRRLVLAAATQGYEFDSTVIALASERDPSEVEERLDQLDRLHGLVTFVAEHELPQRPNLRYRFVHVLYQNALYGSLRGVRKASLSAAIASAILQCYGDSQEKPAAELAFLFEVARDPANAATHYLLAARNASRISAHVEAIALSRRALAMVAQMPSVRERSQRELDALVVLSLSLTATRGYTDSELEAAYGRAWELCHEMPEDPLVFPVLLGLWRYNISRGALIKASELGEELLQLANRLSENAVRLHANVAMGITLTCRGELAGGCSYLKDGAAAGTSTPLPSLVRFGQDAQSAAELWCTLGLAALGRVDEARALEERSLSRLRRISHPFSLAYGLTLAARLWQFLDHVDETRSRADEAAAIATAQSFSALLVVATIYRQWADVAQGGSRVAELRDAVAAYRRSGAGLMVPHFLSLLADAYVRTGELDAASAALAEAGDVCKASDERLFEPEIYRLRGLLLEKRGNDQEAEACFQQSLEVATRHGAQLMQVRSALNIGQLWQRQGKKTEVRYLLTPLASWFDEHARIAEFDRVRALLADFV